MGSIDALCADPDWAEMVARVGCVTDVLELISLRETQHSDILAWLFDARQGHGQGDSIFRDFLLAVHASGSRDQAGDRIRGKNLTRDFIAKWTPSRILTSDFSSAVFHREHGLNAKGHSTKSRLDLLIVDPNNEFIIAIENKAGTRLVKEQLRRYANELQKSALRREPLKNYSIAFVALDREYDDGPETQAPDGRWALLSYSWLKRAAHRAELAEQRGNRDGHIVISYCRQQLSYESPNDREMRHLARNLVRRHPAAIESIKQALEKFCNPGSWTKETLDPQKKYGALIRLVTQNKAACEALVDTSRAECLHASIVEIDGSLDFGPEDRAYLSKTGAYVDYRPKNAVPSLTEYWPLYVRARIEDDGRTFLSTIWRPMQVHESKRQHYATLLENYFGKRNLHSKGGALLKEELSAKDDVAKRVINMINACDEALSGTARRS